MVLTLGQIIDLARDVVEYRRCGFTYDEAVRLIVRPLHLNESQIQDIVMYARTMYNRRR